MDLKEFCNSLSKKDQIITAIKLARLALPVWQDYAGNEITYTDTVVGMYHSFSGELLEKSINEVEKVIQTIAFIDEGKVSNELITLYKEFSDPVISLQDDDLHFPTSVATIFYAVYNMMGSMIPGEFDSADNPRIYVSFNQSIETIVSERIFTIDEVAEKIGWN